MCTGLHASSSGLKSPTQLTSVSFILFGPAWANPVLLVQSWPRYPVQSFLVLMLSPSATSSWLTQNGGLVPVVQRLVEIVGTANSISSEVLLSGSNRHFRAVIIFLLGLGLDKVDDDEEEVFFRFLLLPVVPRMVSRLAGESFILLFVVPFLQPSSDLSADPPTPPGTCPRCTWCRLWPPPRCS